MPRLLIGWWYDVGRYNKAKFTQATFRRDLLRKLDALKMPGESRNDVLERILSWIEQKGFGTVKEAEVVRVRVEEDEEVVRVRIEE